MTGTYELPPGTQTFSLPLYEMPVLLHMYIVLSKAIAQVPVCSMSYVRLRRIIDVILKFIIYIKIKQYRYRSCCNTIGL